MKPSIVTKQVTIANGGTQSTVIDMQDYNDQGKLILAGIFMPGTVDAKTLQVQYSLDNSTWATVTAATITHTASTYMPLSPAEYSCVPGFARLLLGGAAGAERNYTIVMRSVD